VIERFLPPAASEHASAIDAMLAHVHWMMLALFVGWSLYYIYMLVRYRSGRHPHARREGTRGRLAMLVFAGVVIAEAVLLIGSALPLWFERTTVGPMTGTPVVMRVVAEQFAWNVHYPGTDGQFGATSLALVSSENPLGLDRASRFGRDDIVTLGDMHVPLNRPVVIELSSKDVVHSFGVPAMRVKQDVIPGLRTPVSFTPTLAGTFEIVCSQLCGVGHHRMRAVITAESAADFDKFMATEASLQIK